MVQGPIPSDSGYPHCPGPPEPLSRSSAPRDNGPAGQGQWDAPHPGNQCDQTATKVTRRAFPPHSCPWRLVFWRIPTWRRSFVWFSPGKNRGFAVFHVRPSRSGSELRTEFLRFRSHNIALFSRTFVIFPTKTATSGGRNSSFSAPAGRGFCRKNHFSREKECNIVRTKPDESTCQLSPTEGRSYVGSARTPVFSWGKLVERGRGVPPLPLVSVARGAPRWAPGGGAGSQIA